MGINYQDFKAVFLDLDGTILNGDGVLSSYTINVINRLIESKKIEVFINTGRSVTGTLSAIQGLNIQQPLICYNSLVIYEHQSEKYLKNKTIQPEMMPKIMDLIFKETDFFLLSRFEKRYTLGSVHPFFPTFSEYLKNCEIVNNRDALPEDSVVAISVIVPEERAVKLSEEFNGHAPFRKKIILRHFPVAGLPGLEEGKGLQWCYIHQFIPGKCEGFDFVKENYGITSDQVIAIGDSSNDFTMIQKAGLGIAVGNAEPAIKEVARMEIGHHHENSVAKFLEEKYLN